MTGVDAEGDVRVAELTSHPFFVATLFQPELSALGAEAHPLVCAFVRAARSYSTREKRNLRMPTRGLSDKEDVTE